MDYTFDTVKQRYIEQQSDTEYIAAIERCCGPEDFIQTIYSWNLQTSREMLTLYKIMAEVIDYWIESSIPDWLCGEE